VTDLVIDQPGFTNERAMLEKTWAPARGLIGWLTEPRPANQLTAQELNDLLAYLETLK
jgi:hypothetical protein